jgi:anti-anti-sigma factor
MTDAPIRIREVARGRGVVHVRLQGELDLVAAPLVERRLCELCCDGLAIVVDLRDVTFMDSSGLRALIFGSQEAARQGCSVEIGRGSAEVMRVFDLSGLTERLPYLAR